MKPLVKLLRSKDSRCQLKAARALQALAEDNQYAQEEIDNCDAGKPLIRLLKLWDVNMKEQGIITNDYNCSHMHFPVSSG